MAEVDLDRLAAGYRHRPPSDASLERARAAGNDLHSGSAILDVGGGPGHHAAVWRELGHRPVVLDPAEEMTRPAVERGITVVRGVSQALPFRDNSFDLVWFHLSLHYGDWAPAVDEAVRATKPGGRIEIWTLAPDHHATSMLARWFPSVAAVDAARFPESPAVQSHLRKATGEVSRTTVIEHMAPTAGEWVAAVEAGYISTLQLLDESELGTGIAAFRSAHPDPAAEVGYELKLDHIVATTR
ncbi:MAG: hypothetical protein BMS9Abin07_0073 [Acidimicrobiia bacterium]|nr:MAG: hypothetical protein BMS9Abin07_0073 [Acidimicrobiia bacterium]